MDIPGGMAVGVGIVGIASRVQAPNDPLQENVAEAVAPVTVSVAVRGVGGAGAQGTGGDRCQKEGKQGGMFHSPGETPGGSLPCEESDK